MKHQHSKSRVGSCLIEGLSDTTSPRCRRRQRGVAALEFALIMPSVIALFFGIGTFGSALYAKQVLYDVAGEAARTCVLKSYGNYDAVNSCVTGVGSFLTKNVHQDICQGAPVTVSAQIGRVSSLATSTPSIYPQQIDVLQVTATCNWNFAPGFGGFSLTAPTLLSASASFPLLYDTAPL